MNGVGGMFFVWMAGMNASLVTLMKMGPWHPSGTPYSSSTARAWGRAWPTRTLRPSKKFLNASVMLNADGECNNPVSLKAPGKDRGSIHGR